MRPDKKIDYLEFPAKDLEAAQKFYEGLLGWKFVSYGPEYVSFNDGRMDGGFYKADKRADVESGSALIVLYAADLEAMEAAVQEHGGTIAKEIFSFPGGRRFHFRDPNGNELAVWSDQ